MSTLAAHCYPRLPGNGFVFPVYEFATLLFSEGVENIEGACDGFRDRDLRVVGRIFVEVFGYASSKCRRWHQA